MICSSTLELGHDFLLSPTVLAEASLFSRVLLGCHFFPLVSPNFHPGGSRTSKVLTLPVFSDTGVRARDTDRVATPRARRQWRENKGRRKRTNLSPCYRPSGKSFIARLRPVARNAKLGRGKKADARRRSTTRFKLRPPVLAMNRWSQVTRRRGATAREVPRCNVVCEKSRQRHWVRPGVTVQFLHRVPLSLSLSLGLSI